MRDIIGLKFRVPDIEDDTKLYDGEALEMITKERFRTSKAWYWVLVKRNNNSAKEVMRYAEIVNWSRRKSS